MRQDNEAEQGQKEIAMEGVTHETKLVCPESECGEFRMALQSSFWIDEQEVWNVDCDVCGGEHRLSDMIIHDFEDVSAISKAIIKLIQDKIECLNGTDSLSVLNKVDEEISEWINVQELEMRE